MFLCLNHSKKCIVIAVISMTTKSQKKWLLKNAPLIKYTEKTQKSKLFYNCLFPQNIILLK